MCFSAPVSFLASGTLTAIGVSAFRIAPSKTLKILSIAPIVFGVQQAMEGFQWLSLDTGHPNMVAAYVFLFFAFPFWLVYVPLVVLLNAKPPTRHTHWWFLGLGIAVSLFYLWVLLFNQVGVVCAGQSIKYLMTTTSSVVPSLLYLFVVCGSLISFKEKSVRWFGVLIFISAVVTQLFYKVVFTSVWCFFAAILSSLIYVYIRSKNTADKSVPGITEPA